MKLSYLLAFLLLSHSLPAPDDQLTINQNGDPIIVVNRADFFLPVQLFPLINQVKLNELKQQVEQTVNKPPVNAGIDQYGNIIPEQTGISLNRNRFTGQFLQYFYGTGAAVINVPLTTTFPRVDSELISEIRTKRLGHYVTFFNSRNKERTQNIILAAAAINNHVVFPGETFSFNQVVGKRTREKGYLPAPVIVKGELSEGIGGGICQVSSTLYNAADGSGLTIGQRFSHSKRVPYVPSRRDATVSWYGPDFTFSNPYDQPILIRAQVQAGKMIVLIFSSDTIDTVPRHVPRMDEKLPKETPVID